MTMTFPRRGDEALQLPLLRPEEIRDEPPDLAQYRDEGCQVWHACLSCPFPRCIYEEPGGPKRALNAIRDRVIRRLFAQGDSATLIAREFGIARRTVYRALDGDRPGAKRGPRGAGLESPVSELAGRRGRGGGEHGHARRHDIRPGRAGADAAAADRAYG